ncbi:MAG TPA: carboxypeptidase-like regulatory domain-containing protein, partial [Pyrinomonadaceae bacterium]
MQARWYYALFLGLLGFSSLTVCAQSRNTGTAMTGQVSGQVRYADSGQPAYNVMVSCDAIFGGLIGQVQTDRNGRFRFTNLAAEQYNISVRVPGYVEERQTVELLTSPSANVQFQLKPDKVNLPITNPGIVDASVPPAAKREFDEASKKLA